MSATAGRRPFIAACIVLLLFGGTHMVTFLSTAFKPPTDPLQIDADRAMRAVTLDMGPFHTHAAHLVHLLSASYSPLLIAVAVINLIALPGAIAVGRFRALTIANLILVGLLLAITIAYQFPPPMVFSAVAAVLFAVSLARQGSRGAQPG
jgi:hypothetical protein